MVAVKKKMERSASWTSSGTEKNQAVGATVVKVEWHSLIYVWVPNPPYF